MKERSTFQSELISEKYFFESVEDYDEKTFRKKWKSDSFSLVNEFFGLLNNIENFSSMSIESSFKKFIEKKEIGMGSILPNLRLILTGKGMGPSLFEIATLLGKEEVMKRFKERSKFFQNMFIKKQNESH